MRPLTPDEREHRLATVAMHRANGLGLAKIAPMLGMSYEILRQWMKNQHHRANSIKPRGATQPRLCLKCRHEFPSEGAHNRLCSSCNSHSHLLSPYAPNPGGSTGRQRPAALRSS